MNKKYKASLIALGWVHAFQPHLVDGHYFRPVIDQEVCCTHARFKVVQQVPMAVDDVFSKQAEQGRVEQQP